MNNTYSLIKLLDDYDVIIPKIQRDYAQGRKDKEYIRKTFLTEIKNSVENNKPVTLDFVYGNVEGERFYPLDGQQRLTTLWLIHWYISFMAGQLSDKRDLLKKFSYETRKSSKDFCSALCYKMPAENQVTVSMVDYIKSQTWFYSSWLQDPTISAMLRTIGGDNGTSDDNIEAIFKGVDFSGYYDKLFKESVINFELMVIGNEQLPVSDDLYIKMNARGKELTDFENLKADLVAWIQNPQNPEKNRFAQNVEQDDKTYKEYFPAQIDNAWMDVFWDYTRKKAGAKFDGRIDDIYYSFINRYVLNEICLNKEMFPAEYAADKESDAHKEIKEGFDKLYGNNTNESQTDGKIINYAGFDVYKAYITFDNINKLNHMFKILSDENTVDMIDESLKISDADKEESTSSTGYTFIPHYIIDSNGQISVITSQKERVYFLAITSFIENCRLMPNAPFDEQCFNKWMRVVRNITENAAIDSIPAMVTCMRLIRKLANQLKDHNNDIYETLKAYPDPSSNSQLENQLKEEKNKAEKILENESWEEKFIEAERYAFFNGTIRFLYMNGSNISWDDFDTKFTNAKRLFKSNQVSIKTIDLFLKMFSRFEEIQDKYLFTTIGYHARNNCWKRNILCSGDACISEKVHGLLIGAKSPSHEEDYESFINSGLINKIVSKTENYRYRYHRHIYWAIHKDYSQTEGVYVSSNRREKCEKLKAHVDEQSISLVDADFNSYHKGYYWGIRVIFKYKDVTYIWHYFQDGDHGVDKIYKYENNKELEVAIWNDQDDLLSYLE